MNRIVDYEIEIRYKAPLDAFGLRRNDLPVREAVLCDTVAKSLLKGRYFT